MNFLLAVTAGVHEWVRFYTGNLTENCLLKFEKESCLRKELSQPKFNLEDQFSQMFSSVLRRLLNQSSWTEELLSSIFMMATTSHVLFPYFQHHCKRSADDLRWLVSFCGVTASSVGMVPSRWSLVCFVEIVVRST